MIIPTKGHVTFYHRILKIVRSNFAYLRKNPKHLAWCMLNYQLAHRACYELEYSVDNPKYPILDPEWPGLSEYDKNLWYEAWGVTIGDFDRVNDQVGPCPHVRMTVDDWHALYSNPEYVEHRYHGGGYWRHVHNLMLDNGHGWEWHSDGYIMKGDDGVDSALFWGFTQCKNEIPPKIRSAIRKVTSNTKIKARFDELYEEARNFNTLTGKAREREEQKYYYKTQRNDTTGKAFTAAEVEAKMADYDRAEESFGKAFAKASPPDRVIPPEEAEWTKLHNEGLICGTFSPGFERLSNMPDLAHVSYIRVGIEICEKIVSGKMRVYGRKGNYNTDPCTPEMVKVAKNFLKKWVPRLELINDLSPMPR
jgi:hypothetical protein